jgi:hypothetical protein
VWMRYLEHFANVAGTKNFVDYSKFFRIIWREIRRKYTILSTTASKEFAWSTRGISITTHLIMKKQRKQGKFMEHTMRRGIGSCKMRESVFIINGQHSCYLVQRVSNSYVFTYFDSTLKKYQIRIISIE